MNKTSHKKKKFNNRQQQLSYLSQSILLEEAVNPHIIRLTMLLISMAILIFIVWASFTNINELSRAEGQVVPQSFVQSVQHLEGGIIDAILVKEGDLVEKDDLLVKLNGAGTSEDLFESEVKLLYFKLQAEKLRAFVNHLRPNFNKIATNHKDLIAEQKAMFQSMIDARDSKQSVLANQIIQKNESIKTQELQLQSLGKNIQLSSEMLRLKKELYSKGNASKMSYLQMKQTLNTLLAEKVTVQQGIKQSLMNIEELNSKITASEAKYKDNAYQQLDQVEAQLAQTKELVKKLQNRVNRLEIHSPVYGLVKGLQINTIGGVIHPGQVLMEIVPLDENLIVEIKILPKDIGHISVGHNVQVKVSSYEFTRYGTVSGQLDFISATTFSDSTNTTYYKGRVILSQAYVGDNPAKNLILPGMTVEANIITGEKTVLNYLLKPIHISMKTAFTER